MNDKESPSHSTQHSTRRREQQHPHVAIIGASYAGLTLANTLELNSISYTIYDSKSLPFTYITGGAPFNVPSYLSVLRQLRLVSRSESESEDKSKAKYACSDENDDDDNPTREDVICTLLRRVKANIVCRRNVMRIERSTRNCMSKEREGDVTIKNTEFYLHSTRNNIGYCKDDQHENDQNVQVHGPFQYVVGADGVLSKCRESGLLGTYLIGDARWVNDRFYDFGFRRINEGADVAMLDAIEMGNAIKTQIAANDSFREGREGQMTQKFCARKIWVVKVKRQRMILVVVIAMIFVKLDVWYWFHIIRGMALS